MLSSIFLAGLVFSAVTSTQAAVIESKHKPILRPKSLGLHRRSFIEEPYLVKRGDSAGTGSHSCGNSDGAILNPANIVSDALAAGLPYASATGVIFMQASVTDTTDCGAYTCSVSTDASGSSWLTMPILTDVPTAQAGCGAAGSATDYSLVAQLPANTVCTCSGGACLIMCKSQRATLGNCAAVAYSPVGASSAAPQPSSIAAVSTVQAPSPAVQTTSQAPVAAVTTVTSAVDATSFVTTTRLVPTTQVVPTIQTTPIRQVPARLPSSAASSVSRSSVESNKPIATIVGFSGDNGPGGLAEQHVGSSGFAVGGDDLSQGQSSGASRLSGAVGIVVAALVALTSVAILA